MILNSLLVMFATLLSRILGLVRITFTAYIFGANGTTDAYLSAFKLTNFFRQLLGEGAMGSVFIPVFNEKNKKEGEEEAKKLIFSVMNIIFIFTMIVTVLMIIFSVFIINVTVFGYDDKTKELTVALFNIMAFYFVFIGLGSMLSAILNNYKKFFMPAFMSVMFNVAMIIIPVMFYKSMGIYSMAWGTLIGGLLEFVILLPQFMKIIKKYSFKIDFKDPYLLKMAILLGPMMIGIMSRQVNTLVDQFLGSGLPEGTITALDNSTRIYNLPLGMFGISVATVIFPVMSRMYEDGKMDDVKKQIEDGLKFLMFFIMPSMFLLTFFSTDVVKVILGYGKFDSNDIKITSECLIYYSLGLYFYTAIYLLSRAFYIMKNTKEPVKFSVISIFTNTVLAILFVGPFKHIGLAFSASIAAFVNFALLYFTFTKKYLKLDNKDLLKFLFITSLVSLAAGIPAFFVQNSIAKILIFVVIYILFFIKHLVKHPKILLLLNKFKRKGA